MYELQEKAILTYVSNLAKAHNEENRKLCFVKLIADIYRDDKERQKQIEDLLLGAEAVIRNIPLSARRKTSSGQADSLFNNVILEFKAKLTTKTIDVENQLKDYVAGHFNSLRRKSFTLIATDCATWHIYAPMPDVFIGKKKINSDDIQLHKIASMTVSDKNALEFFQFLDRYLFQDQLLAPTLKNIREEFGGFSDVFRFVINEFEVFFETIKDKSEIKLAREEWQKCLADAYGSFDGEPRVFLIHAYLSVFAKMLAYTVVFKDDYIDDDETVRILNGDIFRSRNIENFVERDFFHWLNDEKAISTLRPALRRIADRLSEFDFTEIQEDILKGIYQELIDIETKQGLGEYYTPDWLCEKIIAQLDPLPTKTILDPACGSGSFLVATIRYWLDKYPQMPVEQIIQNVAGIDIHPLSVLISKTNILLALGKRAATKRPLQLRVYQANTIFIPPQHVGFIKDHYKVLINGKFYDIHYDIDKFDNLFDTAIMVADTFAQQYFTGKYIAEIVFNSGLKRYYSTQPIPKDLVEDFYRIYKALHDARAQGRDSIWRFLLLNNYKPFFLESQFDYIVGNPPWITYNRIKSADYQLKLSNRAILYKVKPEKKSDFPHLEIASIFLVHCAKFFLRKEGKLAFVLPRSFMSANQHDQTRRGAAEGFRLTRIWDLDKVKPLFPVPSCVFFADKSILPSNRPTAVGIEALKIKANLPSHNLPLSIATNYLTETPTRFYYTLLEKKSALTEGEKSGSILGNYYKNLFKQGASLVPRNFYFVTVISDFDGDFDDRILRVKHDSNDFPEGKMPWKDIKMIDANIHSNFLFRTGLARNIAQFVLIDPTLVLLPLSIDEHKNIKILHWKDIQKQGFFETAEWFRQVEKHWDANKTENAKNMTYLGRLNYQKGIIEQNLLKRFLVIYNSSGKDANGVVIDRKNLDLTFIADYRSYVFYTDNEDEAYFMAAFFNSETPNLLIKDYQSRGLFGARDVSKTILEIPLSKYNENNDTHHALSDLGKKCAIQAQTYVENYVNAKDYSIGKVRVELKKHLSTELDKIDVLVKQLLN